MEWRLVLASLLLGVLLYCVLYIAYGVIPPERSVVEAEQEPVGSVLKRDDELGADVRVAMFPIDIGSNKYIDSSGNVVYPY